MSQLAISWEALKSIHDRFPAVAMNTSNSGEEVAPQVFMLQLDSEFRIKRWIALAPQSLQTFFGSNQGKNAFSAFLRDVFTEGSPIREHLYQGSDQFEPHLLVQINEAWMLEAVPLEGKPATIPDISPSMSPNRMEALLVTVHSDFGSIPVMHRIKDTPSRHVEEGEFPPPDSLVHFQGRFSLQELRPSPAGPRH